MTSKTIFPTSLLPLFKHNGLLLPTHKKTYIALIVKILALVSLYLAPTAQADLLTGDFSSGQNALTDWQEKKFKNRTIYQITEIDGTKALKAVSMDSASGLLKKQNIDLGKTPYLNWRWRIENRLQPVNEQGKAGDDFAARIYVVINHPVKFWQSQAVNYVWAGNTAKGQTWANPFAGRSSIMIALRSQTDPTNSWQVEKRNVLNDIKQFTDLDATQIDAIAIMTDTDNNHGNAVAYYGDIYFSAD